MRGQVHVYTGNGKGKTTAALGVALRAAGAGLRVFIAQFVKDMEYGEVLAIRRDLSGSVEIRLCGSGCFIDRTPAEKDIDCARRGLAEASLAMASGQYDVVILDEANIATHFGLISPAELVDAVARRCDKVEVIVTGRYASQEILDVADLITEMKEVRHYYVKGVPSRSGIDH